MNKELSIPIIKFVVGLERIRRDIGPRYMLDDLPIGLPDWLLIYNGTQCDMAIGPCTCGAWHYMGEKRNIERW